MRTYLYVLAVLVTVGFALGSGTVWAVGERAAAPLRNAEGQVLGMAIFTQEAQGVRISVTVKGLSPGEHGIHIHSVGKCEPPDFLSAGPHFNPTNKKHGLTNPRRPARRRSAQSRRRRGRLRRLRTHHRSRDAHAGGALALRRRWQLSSHSRWPR
jgi:hypothetical protein